MPPADKAPPSLRAHPFLALFDESSSARLAQSAEILRLAEGERIFDEGDPADSIYLVLGGSVRLTKKDPGGREQLLAIVGANEFFGEFGVIDGHPRSAGATSAITETLLARLPRESVLGVFRDSGVEGVLKVALHIIRKVRDTNEMYIKEHVRKERMTLVGEMANTIIHDLRNPFTVIQLCTEMLRGEVSPAAREKCDLIQAQLGRAQNMIEEILEFSRGTSQLKKAPSNLADLLAKFEGLFHDYLGLMHVRLTLRPVSRVVELDADRMIRVLQNLVNNAVEAFNGQPGEIGIACEDLGKDVVLRVSDNGPGIPTDMRAIMFEPFATMGKRKGIGLGMAIAKSIVTAHGGELTFETKLGKGTTFIIRLPAAAS